MGSSSPHPGSPRPPARGARHRVKCHGGPIDGERRPLPAGATELTVAIPADAGGAPERVAVYRVQRRRSGRGAAYTVLVYARTRVVTPGDGT